MAADRVRLEASRSNRSEGLRDPVDAPPNAVLEATILVRRGGDGAAEERMVKILRGEAAPLSPAEAAASLGAALDDLRRVTDFAAAYGLTVIESSQARRSLRVSGTVAQMETAFGVKLLQAASGHFFYEGALTIPADLGGVISGVLGLDQRPVAAY